MPLPRFHLPLRRSSSLGAKQGLTLSQRLTRAGLAFIVFGTATAVLPASNITAVSAAPCTPGKYIYFLSYNHPGAYHYPGPYPTSAPSGVTIPVASAASGTNPLTAFLSPDAGGNFDSCTDPPYSGGVLTYKLTNDIGSAGPITGDSSAYGGPISLAVPPGGGIIVSLPPTVATAEFYAGTNPSPPGTSPTKGEVSFIFVYSGITFIESRFLNT